MADTDPIAYEALTRGTVVVTEAGTQIGRVEHVLADSSLDLFDGIVVKTVDGLRFVAADQVGLITVGTVNTKIADAEIAALPQPHSGDAVFHDDLEEYDGNGLSKWFGKMFVREHWTRDGGDDK
jgi:hypothetical protein